jgi:CheY-like chemotaxis protein
LLSILSSREEEVLLLRLQSLKYSEIAGQLGISVKTVGVLLTRALRKLESAAKRSQHGEGMAGHEDQPSNVTMGSNQSNVTLYPWGNPWAPVSNVMSSPTLLLLIAMMVGAVGFMLLSMLLHDNHNAGHIVFGLVSTASSTIVAFMLYSGFVKYVSGDVTTSVENPVLAVVFGAVALVTFGYTAWQVLQTYNYHLKFWGGDKL